MYCIVTPDFGPEKQVFAAAVVSIPNIFPSYQLL